MTTDMFATLQTFDILDELSRHRALTKRESLRLEHAQNALLNAPRTYGLHKELIRRGIKRTEGHA